MFSIVVYGQLILEQAKIDGVDPDIINQIFDFMVRDFARFALQIYAMHSTKDEQRVYCKDIMLIKSQGDDAQYNRVWEKYVFALNGEYAMNEDIERYSSQPSSHIRLYMYSVRLNCAVISFLWPALIFLLTPVVSELESGHPGFSPEYRE